MNTTKRFLIASPVTKLVCGSIILALALAFGKALGFFKANDG
jgi:hypothetical protein